MVSVVVVVVHGFITGALNAALDVGVLGSRLLLLLPLPRMFICVVNNSKQIKKRNATFLLLHQNTTVTAVCERQTIALHNNHISALII